MHLLAPGRIDVYGEGGQGTILITDSTFFVFRSGNGAAMSGVTIGGGIGGLLGSVVGLFIGSLIDGKRRKATPPEHLSHAEIVALDARTLKKLRMTTLLCSIPLKEDFVVAQTSSGLTFAATGHPKVFYTGPRHQRLILEYLKERGIAVIA